MRSPPNSNERDVVVRAVPIELSQFIKFGGLASTGGEAKSFVSEGKVFLNGAVETQKGKKLKVGDRVSFGDETIVVKLGE